MPWSTSMVPIVGVALKVQEPYVPGFPFPLVSVTVTRRLGTLFSVAGWNLTPAVSARALPAPKHKTPGAATAATPSAKTTRFFVGLQIFTLRVLSPVAVPPTVCRPQSSNSDDFATAHHAAHLRAFWGLCPGSSQAHHMNGELLTVTEVAELTQEVPHRHDERAAAAKGHTPALTALMAAPGWNRNAVHAAPAEVALTRPITRPRGQPDAATLGRRGVSTMDGTNLRPSVRASAPACVEQTTPLRSYRRCPVGCAEQSTRDRRDGIGVPAASHRGVEPRRR